MPKEKSGGSQVNYNSSSGSWMYVQYFAVSIKLFLKLFSTTTTNWNWSCRKDKYQSYFFHYYFGKLLLMCSWVREAIFQFYCNKHESSMFCYFLLSNQTSRQRHNLNMGPGKYTAGRCWGDTWCTTPVWSDTEGKMTQWESVHFQSAFMYL